MKEGRRERENKTEHEKPEKREKEEDEMSARSVRVASVDSIIPRLQRDWRLTGQLAASITAVPLFASCFYVVAVILGDRFKYDAMAEGR